MNKKQLWLILVLLVVAAAAVYMFKDSFGAEPIQVTCLIRPGQSSRSLPSSRREAPSGKPGYNVTFAFNRKVVPTTVQVFPLQDVLTNKYPHAIWNLRSVTNTPPVKSIVYGSWIRGLMPTVKGANADPLQPGNSYRLVVGVADGRKAECDFQIPP